LHTYNRENVTLVDTQGKGVDEITSNGLIANGKEYEIDCLIFATGFEVGTSYTRRAGYDIIGRGGQSLSDHWSEGLRTFQGLTSHGFPNCFFLGFTQTAITVNVPHALNEQAKHLAHIIGKAKSQNTHTIEATGMAEEEYVAEIRKTASTGSRFYAECTPGYYNSEGQRGNTAGFFSDMHGAGPVRFFKILEQWRAQGDLEGLELS
jgi:cyclohexanone monooxygenase